MGEAALFEKAKPRLMALAVAGLRLAYNSMRSVVSLTVALCSFGLAGAAGGRAEEKFQSSSSLFVVKACGGAVGAAGGAGLREGGEKEAPNAAKGSLAGCGGANADWACCEG